MELPGYPDIVRLARLTGTALAEVELDSHAKPIQINVNGHVHKLLREYVRGVLSRAQYRDSCSKSRVMLVIRFELIGEDSELPHLKVLLVWPNTFIVRARPPVVNESR